MADTLIPTQLPSPGSSYGGWANSVINQAPAASSSSGLDTGSLLGGLLGGPVGSLAGGVISGGLSGLGAILGAAAQRKQKEKLIQWQIQQAQQNLAPQALAKKQGMYVNPYSQYTTDAYTNAVMGNLMSKMGADTLAKWGINANPVSSAGEYGSTQNQLAQYSSPAANQLLNKYGYGNG